jgi:hypothetical protein
MREFSGIDQRCLCCHGTGRVAEAACRECVDGLWADAVKITFDEKHLIAAFSLLGAVLTIAVLLQLYSHSQAAGGQSTRREASHSAAAESLAQSQTLIFLM